MILLFRLEGKFPLDTIMHVIDYETELKFRTLIKAVKSYKEGKDFNSTLNSTFNSTFNSKQDFNILDLCSSVIGPLFHTEVLLTCEASVQKNLNSLFDLNSKQLRRLKGLADDGADYSLQVFSQSDITTAVLEGVINSKLKKTLIIR